MAVLFALMLSMRKVDGQRMLYAQLDWSKLFESASPPGAPAPGLAKATYTRLALRNHWARRVKLRAGETGLLAAIRAA